MSFFNVFVANDNNYKKQSAFLDEDAYKGTLF